MASKHLIQRCYDTLRRKGKRGAFVLFGKTPLHFGGRYIYSEKESQPIIKRFIESDAPCLIPRPGLTELKLMNEFLDSIDKPRPVFSDRWRKNISILSGFFTPTDEHLTRFCCEMLAMLKDVDMYGTFAMFRGEQILCEKFLNPDAIISSGGAGMYMAAENPWTEGLRGKKVLVVHPFAKTIESQYKKRELLFANPKTLPEFELKTIKTVQTLANNPCEFPDWFAALDHMKGQIDRTDFDVALISGGAYGYHLAHHCKMIGKKGIHVAGSGQLIFGIKGKRWLDLNVDYINEHWVSPSEEDKFPGADRVEGGCYW